ncbi:MAG: alkyl hydroperoxide reductase, partial [Actinomycetota bacterium]
ESGKIQSLIGKGLFDFGHLDGAADSALMQHPLGIIETPDGNLLIADTYNRAIRKFSPTTNSLTTIARELSEPSDLQLVETTSGPKLAIVEAAANRITLIPIESEALVEGAAMRTTRPALEVAGGEIDLDVVFSPPPGQKLDQRFGPSTFLVVSSTPKELLREGAGNSSELSRRLVIAEGVSEGVLHVAAKGASCDIEEDGAQCHIHQQDWGIPIKVAPGGASTIELVLSGASKHA